MSTSALYGLSFLINAGIFVYEIAGGRLLAPYLGTSGGVWAGLMAVILGSMALGYWYGGRSADKDSSRTRIGHYLFLAGMVALCVWSLRDLLPTLLTNQHLYGTWGAVMVSIPLFLPPVFLLSALSPMIAKNLITRLESSADVVGRINAIGTAGAIIGALFTSVIFIPYFSVEYTLLGSALLLLLLAHVVAKGFSPRQSQILAVGILVVLLINAVPTRVDTVIADISTAYNRIFVIHSYTQNGEERYGLSMGPFTSQCSMYVTEGGEIDESRQMYTTLLGHQLVTRTLLSDPARMLFLGGCVYSLPRVMAHEYRDAQLDVVEIDPGMTKVATEYFGFNASRLPNLAVFHEDARTYVNKDHELYDLIEIDVFDASTQIPFHLTTREMFERVSMNLSDEGIVVSNIIASPHGEGASFAAAYLSTVREVFPFAELYELSKVPQFTSLTLVASKTIPLPDTFVHPENPYVYLSRVEVAPGLVLTDTYAPVERLSR